ILPPPAPCHWAAASRCDRCVRSPCCQSQSTSQWPDHTVPRCSSNHRRYPVLPPPAPCPRTAASPCEFRVRCRGCRSQSTSQWPNHTVPHCSSKCLLPPPPAPYHW